MAETLTVYRAKTDKYGEDQGRSTPHGTVEGTFAWGQTTSTSSYTGSGTFRGEANNFTAQLFCERGVDLRNRDRITRPNGDEYRVIGGASWDEDFPFDGFDFELVMFQLESM